MQLMLDWFPTGCCAKTLNELVFNDTAVRSVRIFRANKQISGLSYFSLLYVYFLLLFFYITRKE